MPDLIILLPAFEEIINNNAVRIDLPEINIRASLVVLFHGIPVVSAQPEKCRVSPDHGQEVGRRPPDQEPDR